VLKKIIGYLSGNSLSQIILLLSIPFLVNLYDVESFGYFGVFSAYLAILSQVNGLKFENAIIANKKTRRIYYFISCFFISTFVSVVAFFLLIFFFDWLYALLLVLASYFAYMINIFQLYLVRIEKATQAGNLSILRSVLLILFQFYFSSFNLFDINGLILGYFFSVFLLSFPIVIWCVLLVTKVKVMLLGKVIVNNIEFVRYILPQTLINNVSVQLPMFFIESIWGINAAGIYAMALKIVQVPSRFMVTVLRNLFISEFSKISSNKTLCYKKAKKYSLYLSFSSLLIFGLLALFIPLLVDLFLGNEWSNVVLISRCMLIWYAISFINIPTFSLVMVYRKLKFMLNFEVISFLVRLMLFSVFYFIAVEFYFGILILSIATGLLNVYFIVAVLKNR